MHDPGLRAISTFVFSGVLAFLLFFLFTTLFVPRKGGAVSPAGPVITSEVAGYGMLAPVARPLEWTLREIEARVTYRTGRSKWGWAIVLTTFLLHLVLLPFRMLAARNARAMRALQPQIDAINARYRRKGLNLDPEHSRELAEAYKQHQTNPLSGCIPGLAPLAVLVAFYSVLKAIPELHGAPWLWVADLSQPEQLPLRILPLLMVATQVWVARISPQPPGADPRLARLMAWSPLIFGLVLYRQPSALVLYWLTSNLLQLAQQWWFSKRYA